LISTARASLIDRFCAGLCWFLDAGNDDTLGALSWPASKKRQGTKSREVWHPAVQRVLWGSAVSLPKVSIILNSDHTQPLVVQLFN
jgi:hypothetical protein